MDQLPSIQKVVAAMIRLRKVPSSREWGNLTLLTACSIRLPRLFCSIEVAVFCHSRLGVVAAIAGKKIQN